MDHTELFSEVPYHHNEELIKISKDLIEYCSAGFKELKDKYGDNIPDKLLPQLDFYKSVISTSAEYLSRTDNWFNV